MAIKVTIFYLKMLDFLVNYDYPWAGALRVKYSSEIKPFRVKYCPILLAIELAIGFLVPVLLAIKTKPQF